LLALIVLIIFTSCSGPVGLSNPYRSQENTTGSRHKISEENLHKLAQSLLLDEENKNPSTDAKNILLTGFLTDYTRLPDITGKRFVVKDTGELGPREESAGLYLFSTTNKENDTSGFILVCDDDRIGNVLALVEKGTYNDTANPFIIFISM
jgi:hypothetical protein